MEEETEYKSLIRTSDDLMTHAAQNAERLTDNTYGAVANMFYNPSVTTCGNSTGMTYTAASLGLSDST